MDETQLINMVGNMGFPALLSILLITKGSKVLGNNTEAINNMTKTVENQTQAINHLTDLTKSIYNKDVGGQP